MRLWKKQTTLEELCEMYVSYKTETVKQSTLRAIQSRNKMLLKILGATSTMRDITSAQYVNHHFESTTKCTTGAKRVYMKHLRTLIRFAFQNDLVADISCLIKFKTFKVPMVVVHEKYLEKEEAVRFIKIVKSLEIFTYISRINEGWLNFL